MPYYIVICGLLGSTMFFFTISKKVIDFFKKKVIEHKICVLIFCTTLV